MTVVDDMEDRVIDLTVKMDNKNDGSNAITVDGEDAISVEMSVTRVKEIPMNPEPIAHGEPCIRET